MKYIVQLLLCCGAFLIVFHIMYAAISLIDFDYSLHVFGNHFLTLNTNFFLENAGIWIWAGPLSLLLLWTIYGTRDRFGIALEYFDKN